MSKLYADGFSSSVNISTARILPASFSLDDLGLVTLVVFLSLDLPTGLFVLPAFGDRRGDNTLLLSLLSSFALLGVLEKKENKFGCFSTFDMVSK